MADARDEMVWTNHAVEQWETNREPHQINDDSILRSWLLGIKGEVNKVLDYGCGGGLWWNLFEGFDYYGYDQNENMIAHARKRFPADAYRFVSSRWENPPFSESEFDLIFTSAVLQHNRHVDKEKVMPELVRIIRPGGYLMCTENTFREDNYRTTFPREPEWHENLDDGYSFTKSGWEKYMARFGLKLVAFETPSEYLYVK